MQHDLLNAAVFKTFSLHPTIKYQALQRATTFSLCSTAYFNGITPGYRPDAFPVNQPTVSKHSRVTTEL